MNIQYKWNSFFWPRYEALSYRIKRRLFVWVQDEDGDIGLNVLNLITFIKYKESTIILFRTRKRHGLSTAPKYLS